MSTHPAPSGVPQGAVLAFGVALLGLALALALATNLVQRERAAVVRLAARADSLERALAERGAGAPAVAAAGLAAHERDRLRRAGLREPEADLRADLVRHPGLIPFEAGDGAAMFFVPASIRVLSDRWVTADAENGHNGGRLLLEYVVDHGRIRWKRLAASED